MNRSTLVFLATLATGCAWQSEALRVGPDTYQTSANASPARGASAAHRQR
jgi:hypothetical protein